MPWQAIQYENIIFSAIIPAEKVENNLFCYMKMFLLKKQPFFKDIPYKGKVFFLKPFGVRPDQRYSSVHDRNQNVSTFAPESRVSLSAFQEGFSRLLSSSNKIDRVSIYSLTRKCVCRKKRGNV